MAKIDDVIDLMQLGKTARQIARELKITPTRLRDILCSRKMRIYEQMDREVGAMEAKMLSAFHGLSSFSRLLELAQENTELGRRAAQKLLEQVNLNFPPAARTMMRKSFFD